VPVTRATPEIENRVREPIHVGKTEELPALVARLGDDVLRLLDGKLGLFKLDMEEQARGYARELLLGAVAALVIAGGVILAAAGLAFAVAYLLPSQLDPLLLQALAFGTIGVIASFAGWVALRRIGSRLTSAPPPVDPASALPVTRDA